MSASASKTTGYVMTLLGVLAISYACAARAAAFEESGILLTKIRCLKQCDKGCKDRTQRCSRIIKACHQNKNKTCRKAAGGEPSVDCDDSYCTEDTDGDMTYACWCYKN